MQESKSQREIAAAKLGIRTVEGKHEFDHKSLLATMGGWLGIVESLAPGFIFVVVFALVKNAQASVISAVVLSVAFILLRVIRRNSPIQAIAGLLGIAIAAWLALRDGGNTRDYFITGFVTNLAYLIPLSISVVIRWPLIGVLMGFLLGEGTSWRKNRFEMRIFTVATFIWVGLFGIRLLIEYPLYLANNLEALAVTKLILGLPLYAAALWTNWLLVRGVLRRRS